MKTGYLEKAIDWVVETIQPLISAKYIPFWITVSAMPLIGYAWRSVNSLFLNHMGADMITSGMAAFASVGILVCLVGIVVATKNNSVKGMGYLLISSWLFIVLSLLSLSSVLTASRNIEVPEAFIAVGKTVAGLLAALALVPVITMAIAVTSSTNFKTASEASGHYFGFLMKLILIASSMFANIYFGLSRNMIPIVAVLCGVILESMFIWSFFKRIAAAAKQDRFDITVWSVLLVVTGGFIGFVGVETISTLSNINIPFIAIMRDVGATLYVSAVGLGIFVIVAAEIATSLIDWMPAKSQNKATPSVVGAKYVPTLGAVKQAPVFNATGHRQPVLVEDEDDPK